ncbi:hypothetical protein EIP91_001919 [Steccherinum ochraceum]|uniref:Plasma membrane proteolipid Pmp3 n=1 Tax=Steccherinum ochraceum TaxID=92696 RepID=A0A4R0RLL1_9APHY|nr:hypothetical protein EIP91_001919 [Steccherinum ochraceum]
MPSPQQFTKVDLTPRRHHGYSVVLFIMGTLFPPLAVAARFGIGGDFWLNLILTIAGYIPGHVHNFYIQNIRNNKNHARTPKWVQRYGLVDTSKIKRNERRSQWAGRYNDRLPRSTLENQALEEGQEGSSSIDISTESLPQQQQQRGGSNGANGNNDPLWNPNEEQYYGQRRDSGSIKSSRWHYPANFEDAAPNADLSASSSRKKSKKKKNDKKDRWARTEDAYSAPPEDGVMRRKKSSKKKRRTTDESDGYSQRSGSTNNFPEDAEGGLYGESRGSSRPVDPDRRRQEEDEIFNQEV